MKKHAFLFILLNLSLVSLFSQNYFRSGIFLHHSTGANIWGPNPDGTSTTTIPDQMVSYNQAHGFSGNQAIGMVEEWWSPGDNEWSTQHEFFEGNTTYTDINYYLSNNKILVIKSCFPSSAIDSWGIPSDTADPLYKSVFNYKWHWRHILAVMKDHPQNFFAIWTNAPLEINSTNASEASLSKKFCRWAKDTLAAGLDPVFGTFPPNVYVFDYFGKMSDDNGYELPQYVTGVGDSHPNGAGTDFIAPQFVNEIFDAAVYYESHYNGIITPATTIPVTCFPNPSFDRAIITIAIKKPLDFSYSLINSLGKQVFKSGEYHHPDPCSFELDLSSLPPGTYFLRIEGEEIMTVKILKAN
jgi:hypothetical protein